MQTTSFFSPVSLKKILAKVKGALFRGHNLLRPVFGVIPTRSNCLYWSCSVGSRFDLVKVVPEGVLHPIYLRRGTSDILNYRGIFERQEYQFLKSDLSTILDLGGYIGLASIYLANKFPNAQILLVEPDPDNFALAVLNCRGYGNIKCVNYGVWSHSCFLSQMGQVGRLGGDYGKMFGEDSSENGVARISAKSVKDLMDIAEFDSLDFCKIDIEGSEKALFDDPFVSAWLAKTKILSCELHDRMVPGCSDSVHKALDSVGFDAFGSGEYEYFVLKGAGI